MKYRASGLCWEMKFMEVLVTNYVEYSGLISWKSELSTIMYIHRTKCALASSIVIVIYNMKVNGKLQKL